MFINSCIPWQNNPSDFLKLISLCHQIGYQAAIVDLKSKNDYQTFIKSDFFPKNLPKIKFPLSIEEILNYRTTNSPIPLIPRITLNPENINSLKKDLSVWKERRCLIAVNSLHKEILEIAARDGRVDILSIPTIDSQKNLTKGIISLARQNECYLDISLTPIVEFEHFKRTKILRVLYRLLLKAKPSSNKYLIGSDCINNNFWLMRGPKESISFLYSVCNLSEFQAKKILASNAEEILLRFIKRDQKLFIEHGVEIVNIIDEKEEEGLNK